MPYPAQYAWLGTIGPLPRTIVEACRLLGVVETPGPADSPVILGWAKELGLASTYSDDSIPWCGLFAAIVAKRAGKDVPENPLWARNWARFGKEADHAALGDVLVFVRDGGGHVAFYVAEDKETYHVIGGNQSDSVCITRIAKRRCIAVRRPIMQNPPTSVKPYHVAIGGRLSTNEA